MSLAKVLIYSINTGKDVFGRFIEFLYQLAYEKGYRDFEVVPDKIVELADKKFDFDKFSF
jgi:hypothetical protein